MARDPVSRPVSGEILTQPHNRCGSTPVSERDIVEAEYESVVGRYQKMDRAVSDAIESEQAPLGLDILTGNDKTDRRGAAGPAFWLASAVLVGAAFWISGGHSLISSGNYRVASAPANPLTIEDIRSKVEMRGAQSYLHVAGSVVNDGGQTLPLPDLIIQVKLTDGSITRYRIVGGEEEIIAGGRYLFSSRLGAPQEGVENVKVIMQGQN